MERKRQQPYDCTVEVEYIPFPSEEKRKEAYRIHVELFLKARERALRRIQNGQVRD